MTPLPWQQAFLDLWDASTNFNIKYWCPRRAGKTTLIRMIAERLEERHEDYTIVVSNEEAIKEYPEHMQKHCIVVRGKIRGWLNIDKDKVAILFDNTEQVSFRLTEPRHSFKVLYLSTPSIKESRF